MIELQEIIRIYALHVKNNVNFLRDVSSKRGKTKFVRFYEGIQSGKIVDDQTACAYLYRGRDSVPTSTYNSIKMRFFKRILESLYHLDSNRVFNTKYSRAQYQVWKNVTLIRILQFNGAIQSAVYVARKTLRSAFAYQMSSEIAACLNLLSQAAASSGKQAEYEKYSLQARFWMAARVAEEQAELNFHRATSWYAANWSLHQENLVEISNFIQSVDRDRSIYRTHKLHDFFYRFRRMYAEIEQDYDSIIHNFQEYEAYIKKNPLFLSKLTLGAFCTSAMSAYIWSSDYESAYSTASICEILLTKGKTNWFYFQEPHLILALRTKNYQLAKRIFGEVILHPNFNRHDAISLEKWRLLEFYVRFITRLEIKETVMPRSELQGRSKHRHFRAFSSTISTLSKDLQGFNIVAVFAQIVYLLKIKDYDALIQRDESLQVFRRKRLNKLNYRLAVFAKLVHILVESGFDKAKTQKLAGNWLNKLTNIPPKFRGGTAETLEIIPLEDLWRMMIEELA